MSSTRRRFTSLSCALWWRPFSSPSSYRGTSRLSLSTTIDWSSSGNKAMIFWWNSLVIQNTYTRYFCYVSAAASWPERERAIRCRVAHDRWSSTSAKESSNVVFVLLVFFQLLHKLQHVFYFSVFSSSLRVFLLFSLSSHHRHRAPSRNSFASSLAFSSFVFFCAHTKMAGWCCSSSMSNVCKECRLMFGCAAHCTERWWRRWKGKMATTKLCAAL